MRILLFTSDWKWTGPAEPMLLLGETLREKGFAVDFAFPGSPREGDSSLEAQARRRGFASAVPICRGQGIRPLRDLPATRSLRRYFQRARPDLLHCWHSRDHLIALWARRGLEPAIAPALVRSYRNAQAIAKTPWNRWLFGPGTDGLLCVSPGTAQRNVALRGPRPLLGQFGTVDLERFRPAPSDPALRRSLGLAPNHLAVGIVARVQRHRRFDLLLAAADRLFRNLPTARLVIIGRGTHRAELAEAPAARLGIADRVLFTGYRDGDLVDVLRCLDLFTLLVPGSDGTCRALLEAQACGLPAVTSSRGALGEILADGATGTVVEENAAALAGAWEALLRDGAARQRLGTAARARAEHHFAPAPAAARVARFYDEVRERVRRRRGRGRS